MPPPIPRSVLSGLSGQMSCRTAQMTKTTAILSRANSTLPPAQAHIPPESPKYITVPEPPQNSEVKLGPVKGHLPVPREVFTRRSGFGQQRKGKDAPEYVSEIIPLSAAEKAGLPPKSASEAARRARAARRRETLAEGIEGLWERKSRYEHAKKRDNFERQARNRALATAPEGLDDVFTRSTVRLDTLNTAVPPDPARFEVAEAARERTLAKAALKSEGRRDALAQLYMAAANFIVDEGELEAKVEELFHPDYFARFGDATGKTDNMWEAWGKPQGVRDLMSIMTGSFSGLYEMEKRGNSAETTQRQKVVSEELTGGKLD